MHVGIDEEVQAVRPGTDVVVHAPYPVAAALVGSLHAGIEPARAADVVLVDDLQVGLCVEPFGGAVGAPVVDHDDVGHEGSHADVVEGFLQQYEAVECHDDGGYFHGCKGVWG